MAHLLAWIRPTAEFYSSRDKMRNRHVAGPTRSPHVEPQRRRQVGIQPIVRIRILTDVKKDWALVSVAAVVGLVLRAAGPRVWWLNPDEGIYYSMATTPDWSQFWADVATNVHPPLFYLLIRGISTIDADFVSLRMLVVAWGVLAIPALYLATSALAGRKAGLVAAFLVAIAPGAVMQSQIIRPYMPMLAVVGLLVWTFARFVDTRSPRWLAGYAALLVVAVLLHYSSVLVVACLGLSALLGLASGRLAVRDALRLGAAHVPAAAVVAALWLVHVSTLLVGPEAPAGWDDYLQPFFHADIGGLFEGLLGMFRFWAGVPLGALALAVAWVGVAVACARGRALLVCWTVGSFILAAVLSWLALYPFGGSRHSAWLFASAVPAVALGFEFLVVGRSPRHVLAAVVLIVLSVASRVLDRSPDGTLVATPLSVERVVSREVIEKFRWRLESAKERGGLIILDHQTYFVLTPFLRDATAVEPGTMHAGVRRLRWDGADVFVSGAWRLRADRASPGAPDHVLGFLSAIDGAFPDLQLETRERGELFFGGWGAALYRSLPVTTGKLRPGCVTRFAIAPGFGAARLTPSRCLMREGARGS
jgi:hypothetical protein